ncbi:MAG: Nramp family divalent metal transporter, partial [Myxococcota bacterium]
ALLGPSIILAGLSIGSGEFVLWPRLTAEWGFQIFWAAWLGVTIQFFLNMEIERWTLATGESAVTGFFRLARIWGPAFLVCGTVPWIWPGWATGAATLLTWQLGGDVRLLAIGGLVLCGAILSLGPVVYRTVEVLQTVLVASIFVLLVILALAVVRVEDVLSLFRGIARFGHVPAGIDLPLLLGALAFAGAGGTVNLAQSNYIKDKGYGMGSYIGRITSPFTGREEGVAQIGFVFPGSPGNLARWQLWWRRTNLEHFLSFYVLCVLSLGLMCLVAHALLGAGSAPSEGLGFIADQAQRLGDQLGAPARHAFLLAGIAVLFSTELALLDAVARVVADVLALRFHGGPGPGLSRLYFGVLWALIAFGALVLVVGFDQPFLLLVLSAVLNGFVMFLYSGLLLVLNLRAFRGPLRPSALRIGALALAFVFFGSLSLLTLLDRLWGSS